MQEWRGQGGWAGGGLVVVCNVCAAPAAACLWWQDSKQEARGRPGPAPSVGLVGLVPLALAAAAVRGRQGRPGGSGWDRPGWPGRHLSPGPRIPAFYFLESSSCGPRPFTTSPNSDFLPADLKLNPALPNGSHRLKNGFISPQKMAFDRHLS